MSRHTRRARINDLAEELAIGAAIRLRCDSDDIRDVVQAVVDYLISEYPSQDLYIPATLTGAVYPVDRIRKDLASGTMTIRDICARYRVSSKTLYALLDQEPPTAA